MDEAVAFNLYRSTNALERFIHSVSLLSNGSGRDLAGNRLKLSGARRLLLREPSGTPNGWSVARLEIISQSPAKI